VTIRFGAHVSCRKSENFCKWMKHFRHAMKLKKSLREVNHLTQVLKNSSAPSCCLDFHPCFIRG
jgi:hypothetical protein